MSEVCRPVSSEDVVSAAVPRRHLFVRDRRYPVAVTGLADMISEPLLSPFLIRVVPFYRHNISQLDLFLLSCLSSSIPPASSSFPLPTMWCEPRTGVLGSKAATRPARSNEMYLAVT